jgi:vacuolar-type H+-ATPase subunit I/STV1
MLVPMTPVTILAPGAQLPAVIAELQRQCIMHLTRDGQDPGAAPARQGLDNGTRAAALRRDADGLSQLTRLAETAEATVAAGDWMRPVTLTIEQLPGRAAGEEPPARGGPDLAGLRAPLGRIESLQAEHEVAVRYRDALAGLAPLEPELALLTEHDLARLGLAVVILVLDAPHAGVLDTIRDALREVAGERFHLTGAQTGEQTVGCVLVAPHAISAGLHALLAREHVRHVPLPDAYQRHSLAQAQADLDSRLHALPEELAEAWRTLASRTAELAPAWRQQQDEVLGELERLEALALAGATERTAAVSGWLPRRDVPRLRAALAAVGPGITVAARDRAAAGEPPTLLDNLRAVRPYQRLVTFFGLPRGGGIDPSSLTAAVLPLTLPHRH